MTPINAAYVASNKFKVGNDRTGEFVAGRRVKADQGADGVEYFTVESSSYDGSATFVTVKESTVTSNLSQVLYAVIAPALPAGCLSTIIPTRTRAGQLLPAAGQLTAGAFGLERKYDFA